MNAKFVVSHLDQQLGPFSESELQDKWAQGHLLPIDYVYDESRQDWVLFSERFAWASGKAEPTVPPPVKEVPKKRRPPEPPHFQAGAKVQLINGQGEIDIPNLQPGEVELLVHDPALQSHHPLKFKVRAAEPSCVEWAITPSQTVGQDAEIHLKVLDQGGHLCAHFAGDFLVHATSPSSKRDFQLNVQNGEALLKIQHTKAETWTLSLLYSGALQLLMPEDAHLEWQAGPAIQLVMDGPGEFIAGHPVKIQVKAIDAYGNLAKHFQGTITLEVKAS